MALTFHPKMTAGAFAGAVTVIIVAECNRHGIPIAGDEGAALTLVLSGLAGFLMPSEDQPANPPPQ